ncbi:prominin-1 isoform X2 [Culicoides brevitarsis]|uniref:prominin-1 isoform X2 n=1 Tax=Culicoides brevitarsis TaxID=469753 RepID=UPI00307C1A72
MNSEISFEYPEPKPSGNYVISSLDLHDGTFLFSYVSAFLAYVTPQELPVEILRDAIHAKVSILRLVLEALKVESGFICLMVLFFMISLIPLGYIIAWGCAKTNDKEERNNESNDHNGMDNLVPTENTMLTSLECRRKCLVITLQIILVFFVLCVIIMFVTNEQASSAIDKTPLLIRSALKDSETFLKDIHHQAIFTIYEGLNTVNDRIKIDLEDIDKLLGDPIQHKLLEDTDLDGIFESLLDICTSSNNLSHRIYLLQDTLNRATAIVSEAESRLDEISIQLSVLQKQCTYRDRPLCDTIHIKNMDESGLNLKFKKLRNDVLLNKLKLMGDMTNESILKNFTAEIKHAKSAFKMYPQRVAQETANYKEETLNEIIAMRDTVHSQTRVFTSTIRSLVDRIDHTWGYAEPFLDELSKAGFILWIVGLTACSLALAVTLLYILALSCDCCHAKSKARITLIISAIFTSIAAIFLTIFLIFEMIVGGHTELFVCRSFYEAPNYTILSKLIDKPGLIFATEPANGILGELIKSPEYTYTQAAVNVSISQALNECEKGKSAYATFDLDSLLNISTSLDFRNYDSLNNAISKIVASEAEFLSITQTLQKYLHEMMIDSEVNLTYHRMELVQLTPEKDMITFIDQMQRVSLQIQDMATAARMTTLGGRARRLQTSLLKPLENLRSEIVYHLTALELQIKPWAQQVNKSLNQLKTAQIYLDGQTTNICMDASETYQNRLKRHLKFYRNHTMNIIDGQSGSCRPMFDIFDAIRQLFCRHIVDPINGLWFSSFIFIVLLAISTPVSLVLSTVFKNIHILDKRLKRTSSSYVGTDDQIVISQQSNWGTRSNIAADIDRDTNDISLVRRGPDQDGEIVQIIFDDEDSTEPREALI